MDQCDLVKASATTLGTAASFLKVSHVSCNRHGHAEVTAAALYVLMYKAYNAYSWVSRDVTSFAQISVRHVGVPRCQIYAINRPFLQ